MNPAFASLSLFDALVTFSNQQQKLPSGRNNRQHDNPSGCGPDPWRLRCCVPVTGATPPGPMIAHQSPPSMGFPRQEYWSGLPFPSPGDLLDPGIKPRSPALQVDSLPSEPPGNPIVNQLYFNLKRKEERKTLTPMRRTDCVR